MSFDKDLKFALEDIEIPEELMPENIEAMLRKFGSQQTDTQAAPEIDRSVKITAKKSNRSVIMRTLAAAAACVALAAGFTAYHSEISKPVEIESEIEYEAVKVQSYDELYNIYTGIYLNNSGESSAANGDGVEIITDETAISGEETTAATETTPAITEAAQTGITEKEPAPPVEAVRSDFSDADIVKSDDKSIYYICQGKVYVVSKSDMAVTAEIETENAPFEMYVRGGSLVLVSEENVSDTLSEGAAKRANVVVDVYDISSETPIRITTYKQNGVYSSARMDDAGVLYLVTAYSDYRAEPLDETASLDNYVPGYFIDGQKHFVAAEDISVPHGASNTDYTVVSALNCNESVSVSVKAVLGTGTNVYCSDSTLYVTSAGFKDGKDYTTVTAFAVSESALEYKAAATVDGELISRSSMNESEDDMFRIACRSYDENGMINTNIYSLDSGMNIVSSAQRLLPGVIASSVKFDGNYASIMENGLTEPSLTVDLAQSIPVQSAELPGFAAAYVADISESRMVGISAAKNENGEFASIKLELYDSVSGIKLSEITFAEFTGVQSPALTDEKALLIDAENGIVGIPVSSVNEFGVKNQYFVFGCEGDSFIQRGVFEYNDIDDSYKFERAVVNDGVLYIIGSGRMVAVRLSDMTVVNNFDFQ